MIEKRGHSDFLIRWWSQWFIILLLSFQNPLTAHDYGSPVAAASSTRDKNSGNQSVITVAVVNIVTIGHLVKITAMITSNRCINLCRMDTGSHCCDDKHKDIPSMLLPLLPLLPLSSIITEHSSGAKRLIDGCPSLVTVCYLLSSKFQIVGNG